MNSKIKKYILIFAAVILMLSITGCDSQPVINTDVNSEFSLSLVAENKGFTYNLKWWQPESLTENEYYIAVPYAIKDKKFTLNTTTGESVVINGEKINHGEKIENLSEGRNSVETGGVTYTLQLRYTSDLPTIHIYTESGSLDYIHRDKDNREAADIVINDKSGIIYDGKLEYIKGRGNYSWRELKKSYNLKFSEKVDLFNMGSSRKWSILASNQDPTLMKNKLSYEFSEIVGIDYKVETEFVDIFINHEYMGNFTLSERVEVDNNRIRISDLEKENELLNEGINFEELERGGVFDENAGFTPGSRKWVDLPEIPEDITGGYLLEIQLGERYLKDISGFVSEYGQPVNIISPEYVSKEEVDYIANFYQEFEDAVLSETGYNSLGRHYSEYMDMESMAKMYVLQEYIKNLDGGITSFFICKDKNGKMTAGPVWDSDAAFGFWISRYGRDLFDPNGLWVTDLRLYDDQLADKQTIVANLCKHDEFMLLAKQQWENNFRPNHDKLMGLIGDYYAQIRLSAYIDKTRWAWAGPHTYEETAMWYDEQCAVIQNFMNARKDFMHSFFSQF